VKTRIGKLRHRLTLENPWRAADGGGGAATAWESVAEVWGAIETATGGESVSADRLSGERQPVVTIRYRDDVTPAMRFVSGYRLYPIRAVLDPDGRRRFLRCLCEERGL
jgi:SPP1 family predicted phage head-tail adaptor